ncbi:60 kDa chaperonin 1 [Chlamydia avium]|uniref:60 kDa chaperonin n=1 Tax=Chlamydia avium TaxID=1457141 RepID=A0ABN0MSU8_9CHLA|nr:chaperonin GroEL [Chlamydia avium]EPP36196.1 TCP-1/cpn60 chaperonin family protein [Chlamydia psittaci 10_743_SC13]EPP38532.1 TCP-1/cpn60 chaperonin family protein [Chlamydia avium]VVT43203.1 60 kDa chaperonin 1 [Chlamydia avium]
MSRVFKNHLDGLNALHRGVRALANTASATLGPQGAHVIIKKEHSQPYTTKYGASIAKELQLPDAFENMGLKLAREVALQIDAHVGDGSTTAIILTEALFALGLQGIARGLDPLEIKQGIVLAGDSVLEELTKLATPILTDQDILAVATTAANNDAILGQLAVDVIASIGVEGEYCIEESPTHQTTVHTCAYLGLHSGYLSSYFVTHPETMEVIYEDAYVFLCNQTLSYLNQDFIHFLEKVAQEKKFPLIIIAVDIDPQLLSVLIVNKLKGSFPVCAIKIPEQGAHARHILEDIAVVTGATLIDSFSGISLDTADVNVLGKVRKILITERTTAFFHGTGDNTIVSDHITHVRQQTLYHPSEEVVEKRLSQLHGKKAWIYLGAVTENEFKEKKIQMIHALQAIKAAYREGYLPGSGIALIRAAERIRIPETISPGIAHGYTCLIQSMRAPLTTIITNCGRVPTELLDTIIQHPDTSFGYNGITHTIENVISAGICDAFSVMRFVLKYSISMACSLLSSSLFIIDSPEKVEDESPHEEK